MNIHLLPPADIELDDAINYYNEQHPGLGDSFYQEFIKPIEIIFFFQKHGERLAQTQDEPISKNFLT
jgi:hypothetical protein